MDSDMIAVITATVVGIGTLLRTVLEIRKLIKELGEEGKRTLKAALLGVSILGLLLLIMLFVNFWLSVEKQDLKEKKAAAEQKASNSLEDVKKREQDVAAYRRRSIEEFTRIYEDLIRRSDEAINRYVGFDTEMNRKEYGIRYEERKKELLEEAIVKLSALTDHIEKWKTVSKDLQETVNGRVRSIDEALKYRRYDEAFHSLKILKDTIQSDIVRLRKSLDNAVKTEGKMR